MTGVENETENGVGSSNPPAHPEGDGSPPVRPPAVRLQRHPPRQRRPASRFAAPTAGGDGYSSPSTKDDGDQWWNDESDEDSFAGTARRRGLVERVAFGVLDAAADRFLRGGAPAEERAGVGGENSARDDMRRGRSGDIRPADASKDSARRGIEGVLDRAVETASQKASDFVRQPTLKDSQLYKVALSNIRWQRDAYLAGERYANARNRHRETQQSLVLHRDVAGTGTGAAAVYTRNFPMYMPPVDPNSMGSNQFCSLAKWFVPSQTVVDALRPTALWLPSADGPLNRPVLNGFLGMMPVFQPTVDDALKRNLLWLLDDVGWRDYVKGCLVVGGSKDEEDDFTTEKIVEQQR